MSKRRELAKEEAKIHQELQCRFFTTKKAIPLRVKSEEQEREADDESIPSLVEGSDEDKNRATLIQATRNTSVQPRQVADNRNDQHPHQRIRLGDINAVNLVAGTRVFIVNNISHYQELLGESVYHRRGSVTKVTVTGRVYMRTDSGDLVWRKCKNLKAVLQE